MNPNGHESIGLRAWRWIHAKRWPLLTIIAALMFVGAGFVVSASHLCQNAAHGRIFQTVDALPNRDVGVVLGTSKTTRSGRPNLHFNQRIEAAAALYHAGKVKHLLVSGDNHIKSYDEPSDMRDALVAAGVPASAITCDYAGFHTLDSVVRAKSVFGLSHCTIVSEAFHCPRAVWIARQHGLDAIAYAAPDVNLASWSLRANAREQVARAWCALDLYVLHRGPKFSGPREPILLSSKS
jgi:SanA protein